MNQKIIKQIINLLTKSPKIAIFHHINPDGDSLSCSYGLLLALKQKFPKKEIVLIGDKNSIKKSFGFLKINYSFFKEKIDSSYLSIIGDTSVSNRIYKYEEFEKSKIKICFDHHQTNENIKYDVFWKEPDYPASAMQAIEIVKSMKISLNEETSVFLLIGLLTDTNNFVFSLSNPLPPLYYSQLLTNISEKKMNEFFNSFRKRTISDVKLQQEILNNIKFSGKVAYVIFDKNQIQKFPNIQQNSMINLIGNIEKYPIWASFIYSQDEITKNQIWNVHLRSNGPDVSKVAVELGGGGHRRASGAKIPLSSSIPTIIKKLNSISSI